MAGEQVLGAGFGLGQQGADFLVDQPLGALGVTARGERGVARPDLTAVTAGGQGVIIRVG